MRLLRELSAASLSARLCHTAGIRTTLDIDDALLDALLHRLPDRSKTQAIETAISAYVEEDAIRALTELAGSLDIEDVSAEMRARDRST